MTRYTTLLPVLLIAFCSFVRSESDEEEEMAVFRVRFDVETTEGDGSFVVELHPEWAPLGVKRFKEIIEAGVYEDARFFRVVKGFVVQWGIPAEPSVAAEWRAKQIQDDPLHPGVSNKRGFVSFAKGGPNSRTTQLFINLGNNLQLDDMGFPPIGEVIEGMDVVDAINSEYGQDPRQDLIQREGNEYLVESFPHLSYIKSAKIE